MKLELWALRALFAAGLLVAAFFYGVDFANDRHEVKRLQAVEQARKREQELTEAARRKEVAKNEELDRIRRDRDDLRERLRNRPDRMPEAAAATCQGATGAELSGPDAGFLAGYAAEAARVAAELAECQGWVDEVTKPR